MSKNEIDIMWQQAMKESIKDGEMFTRYHFAKLVAERALADPMRDVQRLGQEIEQEPVAWMWDVNNGGGYTSRYVGLYQTSIPFAKHTPLYAHPPQRTWIGLEGAEFGWFCHTDFLNARKYTKEQRKKICNQLMSEAQSWDIGEYILMMMRGVCD